MTEISFPPPRDLPSGHLAARRQHLQSEIAHEQGRTRLWLPAIPWFPRQGSRRPIVVVVVALLVLAIAAVAIAGSSLFGFSNHGSPAHANSSMRAHLDGQLFKKLGLDPTKGVMKVSTLKRLAFRQGIGIYSVRAVKDNSLCFFTAMHWKNFAHSPTVGPHWRKPGQSPGKFQIEGGPDCSQNGAQFALPAGSNFGAGRKANDKVSAWLRTHPFPSPARPILDQSRITGVSTKVLGCSSCKPDVSYGFGWLAGVAANDARSVQVLSLLDCKPVVTVPVIHNVYIAAQPPQVAAAFLVARDAHGKIIWHSWQLENQYTHVPLKTKTAPQHCGFQKWLSPR